MQHTHYCNKPLEVFSVVSLCYGHRTYSAKSDRYETTPGNGRHTDDLEWAAGWVVLTALLKLGTCVYVRTKGCFACIDVIVCSRILHRHASLRVLRAFIIRFAVSTDVVTPTQNDHLNKCLKLSWKHVPYNLHTIIKISDKNILKRISLQKMCQTKRRFHNIFNNYNFNIYIGKKYAYRENISDSVLS